jgi:hypothetical protein
LLCSWCLCRLLLRRLILCAGCCTGRKQRQQREPAESICATN